MTQPNGPYEWLPAVRDVLGSEVKYPDSNAIVRGSWIVMDLAYGVQWEDNEPWAMDGDGRDHPWDHWMPKQNPGWNAITLYRRVNEAQGGISTLSHHIFQLVRGYVWFFDGQGENEDGSASDVATKMIDLSEHTVANLGSNPVLDAKTLTRASDLFFNTSWWLMSQGQPRLQSLVNEIDEPGSDFDGSAADAFSWAMREMALGMLSLKQNITDPVDWTQRLDQSAADIDTFKSAMNSAWSAYKEYRHYDPNQLVWGVLRSMERQVDSYKSEMDVGTDRNAANLREWNFAFPEQDLPGPYNLMQESGWQQLNSDMINQYKPHLDKLNQDSLAATQKLIESFNTTYQALMRPVLPLPHIKPPGTGNGLGGNDGNLSLDDILNHGGGGNGGGGGGGSDGNLSLDDILNKGGGANGGGAGSGGGSGGGSKLPDDIFSATGGGGSGGGGANGGGGGTSMPDVFSATGGGAGGGGAGGGSGATGGVNPPNFTSSTGGSFDLAGAGGGAGGGPPLFASTGGLSGLPSPRNSKGTGGTSGPGGDGSEDGKGSAIADFSRGALNGGPDGGSGGGSGGGLGGRDFHSITGSGGGGGGSDRGGANLGGLHGGGANLGGSSGGANLGGLHGGSGGHGLPGGTTGGYSSVGHDRGFTLGPLGTPPPGYQPPGIDIPDFSGAGGQTALAGPGLERLPADGGLPGGLGGNGYGMTALGAAAPGSTGPAGATGTGYGPGTPFMPPMGGMGGMGAGRDNERERERSTWLVEDSDAWGTDPDCAPAVVGREDLPEPGVTEQTVRRTAPSRRIGEGRETGGRRRTT